ncbi:hypothetical protein AGR4A_pAt10144 [Agrobacterium tumefaciens str. B6]|uniref:Uncharacterized protein n=1 Tax=Agrobacterium tumefaciens str. B6 TaxID=1183423 RepID=A0A822VBB2_AGRTU|nr:hypothetical protein AGR4A_pAt10144 [Agrobacterium tumefaciens str. B6]
MIYMLAVAIALYFLTEMHSGRAA